MPLETGEIDNLLGGVSQKPVTERDANQVEEEVNGILTIAKGNGKRPPSQHTAVLSAVPTAAYDAVHTHLVSRSSTDRYRVILSNGDLKVFDAVTGAEQTVDFPNGKAYLNTADPARDLRCVTIGDYTYITNGSVSVLRGTASSPAAINEALVVVRQGDYNTNFSVTINGITVTYTTPDGSTPATMRDELASDKIASQLKTLIDGHTSLAYMAIVFSTDRLSTSREPTELTSQYPPQTVCQTRLSSPSKAQCRAFEMLPEKAKHGFIVEVLGDPTNEFDNYFVKYDSSLIRNRFGVWKETVKPGILTTLDASTMPHQLVRGDVQYQVCGVQGVPPAADVFDFSTMVKIVFV
jgi:hypothetical protein